MVAASFARGWRIGSPQTVIKNLKMWEEIGVDRMVFIINTGEVVPQERVLKSLRLFAEEVMPAFDRPGAMTVEVSASELTEPAMP